MNLREKIFEEIQRRRALVAATGIRSEFTHDHAVDCAVDCLAPRFGWTAADAWADFARTNDEADALRRYDHYVNILDRHYPVTTHSTFGTQYQACYVSMDFPWPCADIRELAEALGIEDWDED